MNNKRILFGLLAILILFGLLVRIVSLNNDITGEEGDFVKAGLAMRDTGHPVFYQSEQQPANLALWHPPMYIFIISLVSRISSSEVALRSINFVFFVLTAIVIFLFCSRLIEGEGGKTIGLIASAFFMVNYYILSSSLVIDIDMLSCFFVFSFIFCALMHYKTGKNYFLFLAGLSFFFSLANRFPIALLTYFFVGIYYLSNDELRKDFKKYVLVGAVSGIFFILVWGVYILFVEPGNFFSFISHNIEYGTEQFKDFKIYAGSFLLNLSQFIILFTLPATILLLVSFFGLMHKKSKLIKVLLFYVTPVFLFFVIIPRPAFGYPRYFMSIFPGVSILIGIFLYKNLKDSFISKKEITIILFITFLSLLILLIFKPQLTIYESKGLIKATNLPDFLFNISASLPLFLVFLFKKGERWKKFIILLISLTLIYSLYFDLNFLVYKQNIKEVSLYIKERTNESDLILAPKAVGFYSDRKFYINDNNKPDLNLSINHLKEYVVKSYENRGMDDEFFWPKGIYSGFYDYPSFPAQENLEKAKYAVLYHLIDNISPEKKIGDFYIYNLS